MRFEAAIASAPISTYELLFNKPWWILWLGLGAYILFLINFASFYLRLC